jgi:FMN reductase [NAD(P)H]
MELHDLLMKRRSVRRYQDREIPDEILEALLDAANNAPTGGNMQPYSIIVVRNAKRREALAELMGRQPWVRRAPVSLVFCLDFLRLSRWAELLGTEFKGERAFCHFLIGYADLMCAAQSVVILAEGFGLGSVYVGTVQSQIDDAREFFAIPRGVLPLMVLSLGYPKSAPKTIPKLNREVVVHHERYRSRSDDELKSAFEIKYGTFDTNVDKYLEKAFVEALEADEHLRPAWSDPEFIKREIRRLEIKNNAEFLFRFRYPNDAMIGMNA